MTTMRALDEARRRVGEALAGARRPLVFCSFGKDSMLLVALVREFWPFPELAFLRERLTRRRLRFAETWAAANPGVDVLNWRPADRYLVPAGEGAALVREYGIGSARVPVLTDLVAGETCVLEEAARPRSAGVTPEWDVLFAGARRSDTHPSAAGLDLAAADGLEFAGGRLSLPLAHMTDAEVWEAVEEMGVPVDGFRYAGGGDDPDFDPSALGACAACVTSPAGSKVFCPRERAEIDAVGWDRAASREAFLARFAVQGGEQ